MWTTYFSIKTILTKADTDNDMRHDITLLHHVLVVK